MTRQETDNPQTYSEIIYSNCTSTRVQVNTNGVVVAPRHHSTLTHLPLYRHLSVVLHASPSTRMAFSNFRLSPHWCHLHFNERVFCFLPQPCFDPCGGHVQRCSPAVVVHTSEHHRRLKGDLSSLISRA